MQEEISKTKSIGRTGQGAVRKTAPRLGIIGGGQLAKMTAQAGLQLGCDVLVLERNNYSPAAHLSSHSLVGDWENPEALVKLASQVDVVTIENEFVSADALEAMEKCGHTLYPRSATLRCVQDKLIQKQTLAGAGLPVADFKAVQSAQDIVRAGEPFGWPMVLKKRRNGYDGKGNFTVRSDADAAEGWRALEGDRNGLYVEAFCPYASELAVIITRAIDGEMVEYPVVESVQKNHICHVVRAPAPVSEEVRERAADIARRSIEAMNGVGSFGVEMFLMKDGEVLINELAPRVHNTGHYTIEGCVCSQFENHVRAVLGWPLGSPALVAPAAVMVNLLATGKGPGRPQGWEKALAVPGAHVHVYGKSISSPGRKMGHVTALGRDLARAETAAQRAASSLHFGEWT